MACERGRAFTYLGHENHLEVFLMWPRVLEQTVSNSHATEAATQNDDGLCHDCELGERLMLIPLLCVWGHDPV